MSNTSGINRPTILWRFLVMIITGGVVRGQTTPGQNAVAFLKGQTMLDCSMQAVDTSMWSRTTDGTSNPVHITTACSIVGDNSAHYRTEQPGNNICRLIIANVTMQQSGVYDCYAGIGGTLYRSLVTVVDPSASIIVYNQSEVVENDQLNISCSISYNGALSPAPSLRPSPYWITSSEQDFTSVTYHSSANVVTLVATVKVQKPTVPLFHCNTIFEITGNTTGFNTTPPHDNVTFGSTAELDVQYGIGPVSIKNDTNNGAVILTCITSGNPAPNYYWTSINNITNSTVQTIQTDVVGYFVCNATNMIRNYTYSNASEVNVTKDCVRTDYVLVTAIPYLMKNLIVFAIFIICINCNKDFRSRMTSQFKWLMKLHRCSKDEAVEIVFCVCFIIGSLAIGLLMIPIFITIAFCSGSKGHDTSHLEMHSGVNQTEQDPKEKDPAEHDIVIQTGTKPGSRNKCMLVLMWCLVLVALVPIAFIVVYCGPCQEERLLVA